MSAVHAFDAVLYAKDLGAVAGFYQRVLDVTPSEVQATHVVLPIGAGQLWLHAIPPEYASTFHITQPPALREEAAIKLSFVVGSLTNARAAVTSHGGGMAEAGRAWEHRGFWHLDAWDPEGNVIQFRATSPE